MLKCGCARRPGQAREIMDSGPYSLYNTGDPDNDYNAYHQVLDLNRQPGGNVLEKIQLGIFTNHVQSYFSYTGGATKSMVEDYLCTDGLPITLSSLYQGDNEIEDVFENRDPQAEANHSAPEDAAKYRYHLADDGSTRRITGMAGGRMSTTGYHIIKQYNADDQIGKAFNTAESPAHHSKIWRGAAELCRSPG